MPYYALIGHDAPGSLELRKRHRDAHLANLRTLAEAGRVRHAGPLLDESGAPCGSVVIFEAKNLQAAQAFAASDAYVTEGIFERYEVRETRVVFPTENASG
jgi:uncharacterized protein YciI